MAEAAAAARVAATKLEVEGMTFAPLVTPPGSAKTHFLAGAGVRGLEIGGKFIVFTAIGVYLECDAVSALAEKWKGKAAEELADSVDFFRDIWAGSSFEKFTRVSMVLPLTGQQYTEKVSENCVAHWKAAGIYTDAEAAAIEKFKQVFASENLPPGSSTFFTHSPTGSLTIAFSKDGSIPKAGVAVIENEKLTQALLESIIGEHGVSPAAKQSVALRMSEFMSKAGDVQEKTETEQPPPVYSRTKGNAIMPVCRYSTLFSQSSLAWMSMQEPRKPAMCI